MVKRKDSAFQNPVIFGMLTIVKRVFCTTSLLMKNL